MTRRSITLVVGFALLSLALRVLYALNGRVIYDEYQHMHAAYLVAQGSVPFADFFAHHTPLFFYLAALVIPMEDPSFTTMIHARILSLAFHILTILIAALWMHRLAGRNAAILLGVLLTANLHFFTWGCRTYLDTYAAPLVLLSGLALPVRGPAPWRSFASAVSLGLAILFTQKAVFVGLAPLLVFAGRAFSELRQEGMRPVWLRDFGAYAIGGLATAALLPVILVAEGFSAFVRDAVVLNLEWKARYSAVDELRELASADLFVYAVAGIGLLTEIARSIRRRSILSEASVPAWLLVGLCTGMALLPVVWEEYFVLVLPVAVIVAGQTLLVWWSHFLRPGADPSPAWQRAAIFALFLAASLFNLGLLASAGGKLALATALLVLLAWLAGAGWIVLARSRQWAWEVPVWVGILIVLPLAQQAGWTWRQDNGDHRARVDYIMATTEPSDPVFDGRGGFGVFRPHAYWYWFLHDEMQLMLSETQLTTDIIAALEEKQAPIAIVDRFARLLPDELLEYIDRNYAETQFPDIKRRRAGAH